MGSEIWKKCLDRLEDEITSQQFDTCIRPLQVEAGNEGLQLYSPNKYIMDLVSEMFLPRIREMVSDYGAGSVSIEVGSKLHGGSEKKRINGNGIPGRKTGNGLLRDIEMRAIDESLARHNGNKPKAAEELGVSLKTLYNKLKGYQVSERAQARERERRRERERTRKREHATRKGDLLRQRARA